MEPTQPGGKIIVPEAAYSALREYALDHHLSPNPSKTLQKLLQQNGIYHAAFLADRPAGIKHLQLPGDMFAYLKKAQKDMNAGDQYHVTLMDIVVANLVIWLGQTAINIGGEMVASAQGIEGITVVTRDDTFQHYDFQSGTLDWRKPALLPSHREVQRFEVEKAGPEEAERECPADELDEEQW